jgi:hypothetical protein
LISAQYTGRCIRKRAGPAGVLDMQCAIEKA